MKKSREGLFKIEFKEFKQLIINQDTDELVTSYLDSREVAACDSEKYLRFKNLIEKHYELNESISIMGSGNWGYSLNPKKNFKKFHKESDIDVVIISSRDFNEIWSQLRMYHRKSWYLLDYYNKEKLRRNGENIYSGFISPLWIPDLSNKKRFEFVQCQSIFSREMDSREVNLLFFKNREEVLDYYKRGILIAKRSFENGL